MSGDLPAGIAEPLHILEPVWQVVVAFALLALSLALAVWWMRRRARLRPPAPASAPEPAPPPASTPRRGIASRIREVREHYASRRMRRRGCHLLAELLRGHFQGAGTPRAPRPLSFLTAREIAGLLGEGPASRLWLRLTAMQFGRQHPTRRDFEGLCDLALEVVEVER